MGTAVMRVLIVEDQPEVGASFSDLVHELGHQAALVGSAEAAVATLERERPDAVLLDVRLPGMSGLEFLRLDAVRASGVPVVAVSGVATDFQARECLQLGAVDFLAKPVRLERLNSVLSWLESQTLMDATGRRRLARAPVTMPIVAGAEWEWTSVDLSPFGVKIHPQVWLSPGATVTLTLPLPDGRPPIRVGAVLIRTDPDGHLLSFVNLRDDDFRRLNEFLKRLGGTQGGGRGER